MFCLFNYFQRLLFNVVYLPVAFHQMLPWHVLSKIEMQSNIVLVINWLNIYLNKKILAINYLIILLWVIRVLLTTTYPIEIARVKIELMGELWSQKINILFCARIQIKKLCTFLNLWSVQTLNKTLLLTKKKINNI